MKKNKWEEKTLNDHLIELVSITNRTLPGQVTHKIEEIKQFIREVEQKAEERGFLKGLKNSLISEEMMDKKKLKKFIDMFLEDKDNKHDCKLNGCVPSESIVEDATSGGTHRYTVAGDTCRYCGKLV